MSKIARSGQFLSVAALAASTALSVPLSAYAQDTARIRVAQASPELIPPPESGAAVPAPEETEPAPDAAEGDPAELPADEGTQSDVPPEPEPEPAPEPEPEPESEPAPEPEAPAAEEPAPVEEAPAEEPAAEEAPAEEPPAEEPAAEEAPAEEPAVEEPAAEEPIAEEPAAEEPAAEEPAAEEAPAEEPAAEEPAAEAPAEEAPAEEPAAETPVEEAPADEAPAEAPADPAEGPAPAAGEGVAVPDPDPSAPEDAPELPAEAETLPAPAEAPAETLEAPVEGEPVDGQPAEAPAEIQSLVAPEEPVEAPQPVAEDIQLRAVEPGNIAASDAQVQNIQQNITINSVTNIEGNIIEQAPAPVLPPQVEVVERVGNRDILTFAGAALAGAVAGAATSYFIRSNDTERLRVASEEFYVEELPRGLSRETIVRDNGVQVVTIYNRYGDVVQRSRILPDGREVVLFYDPVLEEAEPVYYYDVGATLPPLQLTIPRERYIVDVYEPDERLYYETIVAPPVETVERIYSVDEVRRSERIRDKVRRIDLNTITFATGSAEIERAQLVNLEALANAISQVIDENPDETFLLEGHTDAVGSNAMNLALSDRRAEAVAIALTEYYDIPPENLVTQGYGEEFLKIDTQEANRENRRVTLRRITPLVRPIVTAQAN